tara:strand:+ start:4781 stop:6022 length:1242 start_codon:yes stop_codon:yes gene_type:complete
MATRYWEGGGTDTGNLAEAANWSSNTLPADGDTAIIADSPSTETGYFHGSIPASGNLDAFRVGSQIRRNFGISGGVAATTIIKVISTMEITELNGKTFQLVDSDGTTVLYTFESGSTATSTTVGILGLAVAAVAKKIVDCINSQIVGGSDMIATPATPTGDASGDYSITVTQSTVGIAGNTAITLGGSPDASDIIFAVLGFTGGINEKCTINLSGGVMELSGQGSYQTFDGTQTTINVNDGGGTDMLHLSGTVTTLRVLGSSGTVNVANSSTVTTLSMIEAMFAEVIMGTSVTNTNITVSAGKVTTASNVTTAEAIGGILVINGTATCTTLTQHSGAFVQYSTSGTLGTLTVNGGTFDMSQSTASSVTITTCTLYEGGVIDERSGLGNVTYTNNIVSKGGLVLTDIGRTISIV